MKRDQRERGRFLGGQRSFRLPTRWERRPRSARGPWHSSAGRNSCRQRWPWSHRPTPLNSSSTIPRHCRVRQCTRTLKPGFSCSPSRSKSQTAQPSSEPPQRRSRSSERMPTGQARSSPACAAMAPVFPSASETNPTNRSRAYHPDDNAKARAVTKLARELPRQTEEVRRLRYRRKPIAGYAR